MSKATFEALLSFRIST